MQFRRPRPVSGPTNKALAAATAHAWDAFVIVVCMLKGGTGKTTSAWFKPNGPPQSLATSVPLH
ncbi:hypothetical protein ACFWJM_03955 [Streptomyces sp. NPDC127077]|uniref:hypothetical protein n=1 Tax=Streptomyces sp. NPDC127077 TaxID=3347131 RepID=UPI0036483D2D